MATTSNYGWTTPDDSSLVKDGASAIRTLASAIDSNLSGSILQVVYASTTTSVDSSSATFADTGLSVTITPKFSSSKIIVAFSTHCFKSSDFQTNYMGTKVLRGATEIARPTYYFLQTGAAEQHRQTLTFFMQDSPATTSATTYKVQFNSADAKSFVRVMADNTLGTIFALEVKA
jgi:hypothetical protein